MLQEAVPMQPLKGDKAKDAAGNGGTECMGNSWCLRNKRMFYFLHEQVPSKKNG